MAINNKSFHIINDTINTKMENINSENPIRSTKTKEEITREFCEKELKWVTQHQKDLERYVEVLKQQLSELNTKNEKSTPPIEK